MLTTMVAQLQSVHCPFKWNSAPGFFLCNAMVISSPRELEQCLCLQITSKNDFLE